MGIKLLLFWDNSSSLIMTHGVTIALGVLFACASLVYTCNPVQNALLQKHCLNKLKPKWSIDNVTVLKCASQPFLAEGTSHYFKYLRHGIRDHCICHVLEHPEETKQTAARCF